jgi:hypothetical protein
LILEGLSGSGQGKMKCDEVDQSLAAYLHSEVGRSERELIRAHIAQCQRCQCELAQVSRMQAQMARSLHSVADQAWPPSHAWTRLQANLIPRQVTTLTKRVKHAFNMAGFSGQAIPRGTLFLASALLISVAVLTLTAVLWVSPMNHPRKPSQLPQLSQQSRLDSHRISGPIEESSDWPLARSIVSSADNTSALPDPGVKPAVGERSLVRELANDLGPWRACPNCTQMQ